MAKRPAVPVALWLRSTCGHGSARPVREAVSGHGGERGGLLHLRYTAEPQSADVTTRAGHKLAREEEDDPLSPASIAMSDTNAIKWLRAHDVDFEALPYEFTEIGADHAAEAVGRPLEATCKTLVVEATGQVLMIAIVPGDQRFDARLMASAVGAKHVDMANQAAAEKATGYRVGGISPFATRRHLPVVIEESLLALDRIIVNGGRRGMLVELATEDLVRLLDAQAANICG